MRSQNNQETTRSHRPDHIQQLINLNHDLITRHQSLHLDVPRAPPSVPLNRRFSGRRAQITQPTRRDQGWPYKKINFWIIGNIHRIRAAAGSRSFLHLHAIFPDCIWHVHDDVVRWSRDPESIWRETRARKRLRTELNDREPRIVLLLFKYTLSRRTSVCLTVCRPVREEELRQITYTHVSTLCERALRWQGQAPRATNQYSLCQRSLRH